MNFLLDLSARKRKNFAILVDVDKPSEQIYFIVIKSSQVAFKEVAESFDRKILRHNGFPRKIISDRDSRFTSSFWTELMKWLQIRLNLSTGSHPQTDGQSERSLEQFKKCSDVSWTMHETTVATTYQDWICIQQSYKRSAKTHTILFIIWRAPVLSSWPADFE